MQQIVRLTWYMVDWWCYLATNSQLVILGTDYSKSWIATLVIHIPLRGMGRGDPTIGPLANVWTKDQDPKYIDTGIPRWWFGVEKDGGLRSVSWSTSQKQLKICPITIVL